MMREARSLGLGRVDAAEPEREVGGERVSMDRLVEGYHASPKHVDHDVSSQSDDEELPEADRLRRGSDFTNHQNDALSDGSSREAPSIQLESAVPLIDVGMEGESEASEYESEQFSDSDSDSAPDASLVELHD